MKLATSHRSDTACMEGQGDGQSESNIPSTTSLCIGYNDDAPAGPEHDCSICLAAYQTFYTPNLNSYSYPLGVTCMRHRNAPWLQTIIRPGCLIKSWWRHQTETLSALLVLREGNPSVTGGFPSQRPVTRTFDVFFGVHPDKRLRKQTRCWWFETPWRSLWRHCNVLVRYQLKCNWASIFLI